MVMMQNISDSNAANNVIASCAERYHNQIRYEIAPKNDESANDFLRHTWNVSRYWGLKERVSIVTDNEDQQAIRILYPEGSINPSNKEAPRGGAAFNLHKDMPEQLVKACLSYDVYFPDDFEFVRGGKLPGLYGGKNPPSGCKRGTERRGFSMRYMWRQHGLGTLYAYIPGKPTRCGQLIGYGSWEFPKGKWVTLEQVIVLNNVGQSDGIIRYWVDGNLTVNRGNSVLRVKDEVYIEGIMFSTFFGGGDPSWASPKDQYLDFKNFIIRY